VAVHVLALTVDLRIGHAQSLKEKRAVVSTMLEGARHRFRVAAAETGDQDRHQRAELTFAAVAGAAGHAADVIDNVERFVWSFPEVEVVGAERNWLEVESP
jgi:uncharacterized protein